jgi:hypothetical protein
MPFTIRSEDDLLSIHYSGVLTTLDLAELMDAIDDVESRFEKVPDRISDLTDVTGLSLSFADILTLAEHRKARSFPNRFRSAIIAPDPVHWGFARMFETLNDHPQLTIRLFGDQASARAWLQTDGQGSG